MSRLWDGEIVERRPVMVRDRRALRREAQRQANRTGCWTCAWSVKPRGQGSRRHSFLSGAEIRLRHEVNGATMWAMPRPVPALPQERADAPGGT